MTELFDGVPNSRGLGGLPLTGGGTTRDGVLFRSSALDTITPTGLAQLTASPIGVVADLRTPGERAASADKLPELRHLETVDAPITVGNMTPHGKGSATEIRGKLEKEALAAGEHLIPSLGTLYDMMLKAAASQFATVASLVAQVDPSAENAVLIHCTAGKDRTGIATALILETVGVERDAIVENYAQSEANLAGKWSVATLDKLKKAGIPLEPRLIALVTTTPPEAIEKALHWVDKHGGAANYLRSGGLTDDQIDQLIKVLT